MRRCIVPIAVLLAGCHLLLPTGPTDGQPAPTAATSLAGTDTSGHLDGLAEAARFNQPHDVAVLGPRVFVADEGNQVIRVIEAGKVWTLAGKPGAVGYSDGPAEAARFNGPSGVAVDATGAVYVAEYEGRRIRRIHQGQVTTVAGSGAEGNADTTALEASFVSPCDVEVNDRGELLIADVDGKRIRKVSAGTVTTVAGRDQAQPGRVDGPIGDCDECAAFLNPHGLWIDPSGRIYVADTFTYAVRLIGVSEVTSPVADGTEGHDLQEIADVVGDARGRVYFSVPSKQSIYSMGDSPTSSERVTGDSLGTPEGMAIDPSGRIYIADSTRHRIWTLLPRR